MIQSAGLCRLMVVVCSLPLDHPPFDEKIETMLPNLLLVDNALDHASGEPVATMPVDLHIPRIPFSPFQSTF